MFIQPYSLEELSFAYCHHVYFRWHTSRRRAWPRLAQINAVELRHFCLCYDVHLLEHSASPGDLRVLVSLKPEESVSTCASKLKGQVSKWLRKESGADSSDRLLGRGYFACTSGHSNTKTLTRYLDSQGEHHGYADRVSPPIHVETFEPNEADLQQLAPVHAAAVVQYHIVLATWRRRSVFDSRSAEGVVTDWRQRIAPNRAFLIKASFLPDHVHIALRCHPTCSPAVLAVELMNSAQEFMYANFANWVVKAAVERLFQASAYIGSFGSLESPKVMKYLQQWEKGDAGV